MGNLIFTISLLAFAIIIGLITFLIFVQVGMSPTKVNDMALLGPIIYGVLGIGGNAATFYHKKSLKPNLILNGVIICLLILSAVITGIPRILIFCIPPLYFGLLSSVLIEQPKGQN